MRNLDWIFNDICWCGDSEHCNITDCFRHMSHRRPQPAPDIFTMALLQNTPDCPFYKSKNKVED